MAYFVPVIIRTKKNLYLVLFVNLFYKKKHLIRGKAFAIQKARVHRTQTFLLKKVEKGVMKIRKNLMGKTINSMLNLITTHQHQH